MVKIDKVKIYFKSGSLTFITLAMNSYLPTIYTDILLCSFYKDVQVGNDQ